MPEFQDFARNCASRVEGESEFFGQEILFRRVEWNKNRQKLKHIRRDAGGALRLCSGGRMGFAGAGEDCLSADFLADSARRSRKLTGDDAGHGFCSLGSGERKNRYKDPVIEDNFAERREQADEVIKSFVGKNDDIKSLQVEYSEKLSNNEIYRAGKFISAEERSKFAFSVRAIVGDKNAVQTGFSSRSFPRARIDFESVLEEATSRGRRLLGAEPPEGSFNRLILTEEAASTLAGFVGKLLDGEAIVRGRSPLQPSKLGEKIGDDKVSFIDSPRKKNGTVGRFYDDEGAKIEELELIKEGEYRNFLTNNFVARRSGLKNNNRSFRTYRSRPSVGRTNFHMATGEHDFQQLRQDLADGPVVTSLKPGSGFNTVSGNFSVGAKGYMIQSGEFHRPFCSATLSGGVEQLLNGIRKLGKELPMGRATAAPAFLVENITLGGS